ncbi:MAG: hypothetical protein DRG83_01190 [Deltaproteobacteria bacterium]|nr:MAG: hypothetical protein DRG83_01190 [Deltaproteobacteria bacterium]
MERFKGYNYTVYNDARINEKISSDLSYIVTEILKVIKSDHIHSIVLTGGFGRGEGGVIFEKKGEIRIVNDYDIGIILRENPLKYLLNLKGYSEKTAYLSERLAHELNIKQVDLSVKNSNMLRFLPPTILYYETLNGYKLLYGNGDLTRIIPNFKSEDLPLVEGTKLFLNRGGGLLIAAKYFIPSGDVEEHDKLNFIVECDKAIMAMGDSILLLERKYHYSYIKRKEIIRSLNLKNVPLSEKIIPMYISALENKVKPDFDNYPKMDLITWWFEIQELYDEFFKQFEQIRLGVKFKTWLEYVNLRKFDRKYSIKRRLLETAKAGSKVKEFRSWKAVLNGKEAYLLGIMPLLLFSLKRDGYDDGLLSRAEELLKISVNGNEETKWKTLTDRFLLLWHETGEATRVVGR